MQNKQIGYQGENIVKKHYQNEGWNCLDQNFTIRGGELDLIFSNSETILFIEVKVVNHIDQLQDYITQSKLQTLQKTIKTYLRKNPTDKQIRLDFAFVQNKEILEIYKDISV